ncbi:MAG: hypothetical protein KDC74_09280 [Flavobacteriaceae bacterium]|jgi:hypothetical protein|nr:hypothetical protein [Flavobacteriaceae bacterium]
MNIPVLIANLLTFLAFIVHAFVGDKELKIIEPSYEKDEKFIKQEKWTMARSSWHWISFDLLFASIGLGVINFTDYFEKEKQLLEILAIYFFGYGIAWLIGITISKDFPMKFLKLGQWILLWVISGLIYWGIK